MCAVILKDFPTEFKRSARLCTVTKDRERGIPKVHKIHIHTVYYELKIRTFNKHRRKRKMSDSS